MTHLQRTINTAPLANSARVMYCMSQRKHETSQKAIVHIANKQVTFVQSAKR